MYITFNKVKYKNFLSTGNQFTEIDMTASAKTLIHGTNGSGKTTFVDAVYFALYGKSFRKVKKDSVVNYITKKHAVVELDFSIRNDDYKIIRGIKPAKFIISKNGVDVDQESTTTEYQKYLETFILHMNEKLFTQTVLLGSTNYTPFMLLPSADRRNVIESLLDIQIFSTMNELAKDENKLLTRRHSNTEYSIEKTDIAIDHLQDHIDSVTGNRQTMIAQNNNKIDIEEIEIKQCEHLIVKLQAEINLLKDDRDALGKKESIKSMIQALKTYETQFNTLIKKNNKKIEFYHDNDDCPTCSQEISIDVKDKNVHECQESINKFNKAKEQAQQQMNDQRHLLDRVSTIQGIIDRDIDEIATLNQTIKGHRNNITTYEQQIGDIRDSADLSKEETKINEAKREKNKYKKDLVETSESLINYSTVLDLLKDDGIKSRIVKQYIPVINKLIKKYLDILDFPILFKFDEEFNEYIKVRGRDEVTFPNLSEGERMRVNLSLIFAFRELAKLRNATHCNLIIFDEVADSSLDTTGWDSFLKILKDVCSTGNQNTFIISHKGDEIINKFDRDIRFAKKGGRFSEII